MNRSGNINEKETLNSLEKLSDEELVSLKNKALSDEDYDKAKEVKQEQERRKEVKEAEERAKDTPKLKEESTKRTEDLRELLGDKKMEEFIDMMRGIAKTNWELAEANRELATNNNLLRKSNEELVGIMNRLKNEVAELRNDLVRSRMTG